MITRDRYPHGVPCWIDTAAPDPAAAVAFYGGLFGWEFIPAHPGYQIGRLHGHPVAGIGGGARSAGWNTYVAVDDVAATLARVAGAGGTVLAEPTDLGAAARIASLADPAGAPLHLWQAADLGGAALVNGPGTWNFSDLVTPDPDGASAFYPAVFGWVANVLEFGEPPTTMWRVPGYGDVLAELDPALRERHDDDHVPDGFSDAIGWMSRGEDAARWEVTFSVDDTHAVAGRAAELGGEVVAAPHDVWQARLARLRDPQGTEFTVSTYLPG